MLYGNISGRLSGGSVVWETAADWDGFQSETGVHHEQPTGTDWAAADVVEQGYPSAFPSIGASLLAYYPLGESSGSTANDVGASNDGTYSGPTLAGATGPLGFNAPTFDGTDDQVDTATQFSTTDDNIAVCAWVRKDSWVTSFESIFSNFDGSNQGITIQRSASNNYLEVTINGVGAAGSTDIADGNWHWVYCDQDAGAQEQEIVVDNVVDGTNSGNTGNTAAGTDNHAIGQQSADRANNNWDGDIAHVMVWDAPLTSAERDTIYQTVTGGPDHWTSKKTIAASLSSPTLESTATLNGGAIDVTVYEDVGDDGSGANTDAIGNSYDNSDTVTLAGGTDETNALTGFDGSNGNAYWCQLQPTVTNVTDDAATVDRLEVL